MRNRIVSGGFVVFLSVLAGAAGSAAGQFAASGRFHQLFNGKDLRGWRGRPGGGGVFSPYIEAKFTPEERAAKQAEWNADRDLHWRADSARASSSPTEKGFTSRPRRRMAT